MNKKGNSLAKDIKIKEQGGKGAVEIKHLFTSEELNSRLNLCAIITLEPGCSIGYHKHECEDEFYYVIKGQGRLQDNDTEVTLNTGDCHVLKAGGSHSIENTGVVSLQFVALILPN